MKNTLIAIASILLLSGLGYGLIRYTSLKENPRLVCPADTMMCPDGTEVRREGSACEFSVCKQESPSYLKTEEPVAASSSEKIVVKDTDTQPKKEDVPPATFFGKVTKTVQVIFSEGASFFSGSISSGISETNRNDSDSLPSLQNNQAITSSNETGNIHLVNETRYEIMNSTIVNGSGTPIYTISGGSITGTSSISENWETHTVNAVPVNEVKPVIGGVPVNGLPGKYYVSVNSFGNIENCEFSNRIYILDTQTDEMSLLYEENSDTLAKDDPRACNNEIYLLATNEEKLVLKYHTINTNMVCESSWSEPDKTWYVDVTNLSAKTKRYAISNALYEQAEDEEESCRFNLGASSGN